MPPRPRWISIADLADRYSFGEIRVGHEQNLVLPHVAQRDLPALWRALDADGLATTNVGLVSDIIACPGLDYCSLANARSIPIAQEITRRFRNLDLARDLGRLHVNISGCINACGHHHVGHIGILGVEKNGEEFYQITLGGKADQDATLGDADRSRGALWAGRRRGRGYRRGLSGTAAAARRTVYRNIASGPASSHSGSAFMPLVEHNSVVDDRYTSTCRRRPAAGPVCR